MPRARPTTQLTAVNGAGESGHSATATASTQAAPSGCAPGTSTYSNLVLLSTALVGYWRLGETAGTTACAEPGLGRDLSGGVTLGAGGAIAGDADTAALFGGSGFVSVPSARPWNATRLTLEASVSPTGVTGGSRRWCARTGSTT